MKLIPEARKWHKLWSVRLAAAAAAIALLEPVLPDLQGLMPEWAHTVLVAVVAFSAAFARMVPQKGIRDD